jgi:hypothetical protein
VFLEEDQHYTEINKTHQMRLFTSCTFISEHNKYACCDFFNIISHSIFLPDHDYASYRNIINQDLQPIICVLTNVICYVG